MPENNVYDITQGILYQMGSESYRVCPPYQVRRHRRRRRCSGRKHELWETVRLLLNNTVTWVVPSRFGIKRVGGILKVAAGHFHPLSPLFSFIPPDNANICQVLDRENCYLGC